MTAELIAEIDAVVALLEARGEYYYEDVVVKRWLLGPGGRSGNCEDCVENADEGWIEEDALFPAGDVDEPPLHPHCECEVEYKDTRRRVYV